MTAKNLRDKALNKYVVGQVINLRYRNPKGKIIERRKAEVVKFLSTLFCAKWIKAKSVLYMRFRNTYKVSQEEA